MVSKIEPTGLGGCLNVFFTCSGCEKRSLALAAGFFLSGHGFANFDRTLRQYLGISCISKNRYYDVIKLVYPHLKIILDKMCNEEKERMKKLPQEQLGS